MSSDEKLFNASGHSNEQRSILVAYALKAICTPWFERVVKPETPRELEYIRTHKHYATGQEITDADIKNAAAASILSQIMMGSVKRYQFVLSPQEPRALSTYAEAQAILDKTGVSQATKGVDMATFDATLAAMHDTASASSPNIKQAAMVWRQRGRVTVVLEDMGNIMEAHEARYVSGAAPDVFYEADGLLEEGHGLADLDVSSRTIELPYYGQFSEIRHCQQWLGSLLTDMTAIHSQMQ